jgi:hypothetical protein
MTSTAQGYYYSLVYNCPKCRGLVHCTLVAENPTLPDSTVDELVEQTEVQCESPACDWHGRAGALQVASRHLNMWMPRS